MVQFEHTEQNKKKERTTSLVRYQYMPQEVRITIREYETITLSCAYLRATNARFLLNKRELPIPNPRGRSSHLAPSPPIRDNSFLLPRQKVPRSLRAKTVVVVVVSIVVRHAMGQPFLVVIEQARTPSINIGSSRSSSTIVVSPRAAVPSPTWSTRVPPRRGRMYRALPDRATRGIALPP